MSEVVQLPDSAKFGTLYTFIDESVKTSCGKRNLVEGLKRGVRHDCPVCNLSVSLPLPLSP